MGTTADRVNEDLAKAELAYTAAVQAAAQTGMWGLVSAARQAVEQARSAVKAVQPS